MLRLRVLASLLRKGLLVRGLRFGLVNRDIRSSVAKSCIEYWRLSYLSELQEQSSKCGSSAARHRLEDTGPFSILGMTIHSFSAFNLLYLVDEIFLERIYTVSPDSLTPTILDCGSNIGLSILFFKKLIPGARIIGFEPDHKTFELLVRNVRGNGYSDVCLNNAAVSEVDGETAFYTDPEVMGSLVMSTIRERVPGGASGSVSTVRLSSYVRHTIDFIKMDIEGAETCVLGELAASGALVSVKAIILEYHDHIRPEEDRLSDLLRLLEQSAFGYGVSATICRYLRFQDIHLRAYNKEVAGAGDTVWYPAGGFLNAEKRPALAWASARWKAGMAKLRYTSESALIRLWRNSTASISARPNPIVIPRDPSNRFVTGTTTIEWTVDASVAVEVHIDAPDGPILSRTHGSGYSDTGNWVTNGMKFYLQNVTAGRDLTRRNTLAVTMVRTTAAVERAGTLA
jgi:FkbM family methyltransferase